MLLYILDQKTKISIYSKPNMLDMVNIPKTIGYITI